MSPHDDIAEDVVHNIDVADIVNPPLLDHKKTNEESVSAATKESVISAFDRHVANRPDALMYSWLDEKANVVNSFTRGQLSIASRNLAYQLVTKHNVRRGDRAMIVYPFGIEFLVAFVACLRVGIIVVSVYPPNPAKFKTDVPKFEHFVNDSGAKIALTTDKYRTVMKLKPWIKWPKGITWVTTDSASTSRDMVPVAWDGWQHDAPKDDVAFIQYTSGSTGNPKGIMITYDNIYHSIMFGSHAVKWGVAYRDGSENSIAEEDLIYLLWTPQYHDLGLINYLTQLVTGSHLYGISPLSFIRDPPLWPRAMQRYKANFTCGPNFAIALTCRRLEALGETCSIPSLKLVQIGAEPTDPAIISLAEQHMGIDREAMFNCYGLAENVLGMVCASSQVLHEDGRWAVGDVKRSEGFHSGDSRVRVVDVSDESNKLVATEGQEGEIWYSGLTVAKGYWNKPELTERTFNAMAHSHPSSSSARRTSTPTVHEKMLLLTTHSLITPSLMYTSTLESEPDVMFLRTGDLGYIARGELVVTSRLKDLIIVAGKNIAPTDIEYCVENAFPMLRKGSTVAVQPSTEKEDVILVAEVKPGTEKRMALDKLANDMMKQVQKEVAVGLHRVVLVRKGQVPKTTSGKIQRNKTGKKWLAGEFKLLNSAGAEGGDVDMLVSDATTLEALFDQVGVEDWELSLEDNGVDSMRLTKLIETGREKFGVVIEYADASGGSARALIDRVSAQEASSQGTTVFTPPATTKTSSTSSTKPAGVVQRVLCQVFTLVVLFTAITGATLPSAFIAEMCWDDSSWLWVSNGRSGPMMGALIVVWMVSYTLVCIVGKWVLIGRQHDGLVLERGTFAFARWWTVQRLFAVWDSIVGVFLLDTIVLNIVYKLLGADVSMMTCRIKAPFKEWDMVSIGSHTVMNAMLYPRFFTAQRTVVFGAITIGNNATLGAGAVVNVGASIASGAEVENSSLVDAYVTVPEGRWCGTPGKHVIDIDASKLKRVHVSRIRACLRSLVPFIFACTTLAVTYFVNLHVVPSSPISARQDVWTPEAAVMVFNYLCVFAATGLGMLGVCLVLKWTFVCPYLTDKMARHTHRIFFPYIYKNFLAIWWFRLFGMRISHKATALLCPTATVRESLAHLIKIESGAVVILPLLAPEVPQGTAHTVWGWMVGCGRRTSPPWMAKPDLTFPKGVETGYLTRFESGCIIESDSATMMYSRLTSDTKVPSGKLAMGNPTSCLLPAQAKPDTASASFGIYCLHVGLTVAMLAYMSVAVYVTVETVRSLPIYNHYSRLEVRVPIALCVAIVVLQLLLFIQVIGFKVVVMGKVVERTFPANSAYSIFLMQSQVLKFVLARSFEPFYSGLMPMNLYYQLLGCKVDLTTSLLSRLATPGDCDLVVLHKWCVIDANVIFSSHLVAQGKTVMKKVELHRNAVVHPHAAMTHGTIGAGGMLRSLSCTVKRVHIGENEQWIGSPASCANPVATAGDAGAVVG